MAGECRGPATPPGEVATEKPAESSGSGASAYHPSGIGTETPQNAWNDVVASDGGGGVGVCAIREGGS